MGRDAPKIEVFGFFGSLLRFEPWKLRIESKLAIVFDVCNHFAAVGLLWCFNLLQSTATYVVMYNTKFNYKSTDIHTVIKKRNYTIFFKT